MNNNQVKEWCNILLDRLNSDWGSVPNTILSGYSIFFSPVKYQPDLLIIGDNPGGSEFIRQIEVPIEHEYFKYDYPIAKTMKNKIFKGEKLNNLLRGSVKTNRIFFKTKNLDQFNKLHNSKSMEVYCFLILEDIIDKLNPKMIFAESLGTFRKLSKEEKVLLKKEENGKSLLVEGMYNNIPVLGINHPSRASYHRINDIDWQKVNEKLIEIL